MRHRATTAEEAAAVDIMEVLFIDIRMLSKIDFNL
jgi:hypothetical protein